MAVSLRQALDDARLACGRGGQRAVTAFAGERDPFVAEGNQAADAEAWARTKDADRTLCHRETAADAVQVIAARHPLTRQHYVHCDGQPTLLFCENETNPSIFGTPKEGFFKDGINNHVVGGGSDAVNPSAFGTKAAAHYRATVKPRGRAVFRVRLSPTLRKAPFADFDALMAQRKQEADAFYGDLQREIPDADERRVQRQAFAGLIWSKQFYHFDVRQWLDGDATQLPPHGRRRDGRNKEWMHLYNAEVISMPDN